MNEPAIDDGGTRDLSKQSLPTLPTEASESSVGNLAATHPAGARWQGSGVLAPPIEIAGNAADRFEVVHSHAVGGLGEVFLAVDRQLHREVALKEIRSQFAQQAASRTRFMLEAEITGGLEHPGIVPVYALGIRNNGQLFYAMRFIRGRSLRDAIADFHGGVDADSSHATTAMPASKTSTESSDHQAWASGDNESGKGGAHRLTRVRHRSAADFASLTFRGLLQRLVAVCDAMAYAHSRGVLHRDLKPANIMVGEYGETLVVDWGLAKTHGASFGETDIGPLTPSSSGGGSAVVTAMGSTVGTPAYMSPEQASGDVQNLTVATDIFSLGATLYAMLTNRPPYNADSVSEVLGMAQSAGWRPVRHWNPQIPAALEAICSKSIALSPADRYASCRELAKDLERYLADEPVRAFAEPLAARIKRGLRKHPGRVSAAVAALLVGIASLGLGAMMLNAKNKELQAARDIAVTNEAEAKRQEAEAHKQRQLAEANLRRARKAVDESFTEISEGRDLKNLPGAQPFRRRMLERARSFYEDFLNASGNDPALAQEAAAAHFRLGSVTSELNPGPLALASLERALELRRGLIKDREGDRTAERELVANMAAVGIQRIAMGKPADAAKILDEAITRQKRMVAAANADQELAIDLAKLYVNISGVYSMTGGHARSVESLRAALEIFDRAAKAMPADTDIAQGLGTIHYNLGDALLKSGKVDESRKAFSASLAIRQKLVAESPHIVKLHRDLSFTHSGLGSLNLTIGKRAESLAELEKALAIRKRIAEANPSLADFQKELADSYSNLAVVTWETGKPKAAIEAHRQAVAILDRLCRENPTIPVYAEYAGRARVNLGFCLFRSEQLKEALEVYNTGAAIMEKLVTQHPANDGYLSFLSELISGGGGVLMRLAKLTEAEEQFARALAHRRTLAERHPEIPAYRLQLGGGEVNLGHIARDLKKLDESVEWFRRARRTFAAIEGKLPKDETLRRFKFLVGAGLAMTYDRQGRFDEMLEEYNALEKLWPIPMMTDSWRLERLRALAKLGRREELLIKADEALKAKRSGAERYLVAKAFAMCAATVETDTRLAPPDRKKAVDELAGRAGKLLDEMARRRELSAADWTALEADREMDWFRARPECPTKP